MKCYLTSNIINPFNGNFLQGFGLSLIKLFMTYLFMFQKKISFSCRLFKAVNINLKTRFDPLEEKVKCSHTRLF